MQQNDAQNMMDLTYLLDASATTPLAAPDFDQSIDVRQPEASFDDYHSLTAQ